MTGDGLTSTNEPSLTKWASTGAPARYDGVLGGDVSLAPIVIEHSELLHRVDGLIMQDRWHIENALDMVVS